MPIRTNRGRGAVYRRMWGFPLRSAAHLVGTIAAVVLIPTGVLLAVNHVDGEPTRSEAAVSTTTTTRTTFMSSWPAPTTKVPTSSTTAPPVVVTSTGTSAAMPGGPPAPVVQLARDFMAAWVNTEGSADQWVGRLEPYVMPEYMTVLRGVDPSRLGSVTLTGEPVATAVTAKVVEFDQPTSIGVVHLVLVESIGGGWRVQNYSKKAG